MANPNLELKTYGPGAKGLMITGTAANPQNPTHVWTGLCETGKCAMTLRDKTNFLDLSGQAKIRWVSKVSGFQKIHPIVKLADGTFLAGDWADGSTGDWRESEAYFAEMRWVKMDPARVATTGAFLDKVDLSKVDEIGWSDFMVASGHGQGGWSDVGENRSLRQDRSALIGTPLLHLREAGHASASRIFSPSSTAPLFSPCRRFTPES